jgi:hypothetical protein
LYSLQSKIRKIRSRKMKCIGHVALMSAKRDKRRIFLDGRARRKRTAMKAKM